LIFQARVRKRALSWGKTILVIYSPITW